MQAFITSALFLVSVSSKHINDYYSERAKILAEELQQQVGGNLILTDDESRANEIIMRYKNKEVDDSVRNPSYFNFSKSYFTYKDDIKNSKVYQIIKRMPKGAALHVHSTLMLSADRLLLLTYEPKLYACFENEDLKLRFSNTVPARPCSKQWQLLSLLRNKTHNVSNFDENLKKYFYLNFNEANVQTKDINYTWKKFDKVIGLIADMITYRPVREKFFYEALKEYYEDKIMYVEIRSGLAQLYELNGTLHDFSYMVRVYRNVAKRFKEDHPNFVGVKFIVTGYRQNTMEQIQETVNIARKLKEELPDFFAGLDLVGQEDLGKPLIDYLPVLKQASSDINFYFHAGETNWYGTSSDENLVDAILLGSKRIGHAYALIKHPSLMVAVKTRDIAIEVNVISNLVLSLVSDVRNHPLASYLALGMPVVLSSDDAGAWGADPLSQDFYIAFVGIASKKADLRMLKQLVINSVRYSALDNNSKLHTYSQLYREWNEFIKYVIKTFR